jgi:hypothetical protein
MLALRYFACDRCETVYASPDTPPWCDSCGCESVEEITERLQTDAYFLA